MALKEGLGGTLGLESGAPSRLMSLRATWAQCSRGELAQPLLQWGVTRHTSMSDMSEQLAGRPGIWLGLTPAICSFRAGLF